MADAITIKALQDASLDAKSLSEFVFKPASFMVQRRLAPSTNTLQYYLDLFENISIGGEFNSAKIESLTVNTGEAGTQASVVTGGTPSNRTFALTIPKGDKGAGGKSAYQSALDNGFIGTEAEWKLYLKSDGSIQALQQFMTNPAATNVTVPDYGNIPSLQGYISTMFENGGLPATPFATKALMTASALVDGDYAAVTHDDTANNGLYVKTAGSWVKSGYDLLTQAKQYADSNPLFKPQQLPISGTDADSLENGVFIIETSAVADTVLNLPTASSSKIGTLFSYRADGISYQKFVVYNKLEQWERVGNGGSTNYQWQDWKEVLTRDDVDDKLDIVDDKLSMKIEFNLFKNTNLSPVGAELYQATANTVDGVPTLIMNTDKVSSVNYLQDVDGKYLNVGDTVVFSAEIFSDNIGTSSGDISLQALSSTGTVISISPTSSPLEVNTWSIVSQSFVIPTNAAKLRLRFIRRTGNTVANFRKPILVNKNPAANTFYPLSNSSNTSTTTAYVKKTGSDSNDGSLVAPFLTIQKAIDVISSTGGTVIVLDSEAYREALLINTPEHIKITTTSGNRVNIFGSAELVVTKTAGFTKVYQAPLATKPVGMGGAKGKPAIFEWGTPSKLIPDGERHFLQRGLTHRLPYTELNEVATKAELDSVNGKWFWEAGIIYFSATDGSDATLKRYEARMRYSLTHMTGSIELDRVSVWFSSLNGMTLRGTSTVRKSCTAYGSRQDGFSDCANTTVGYRDIAGGNGNDGFNATVADFTTNPEVNDRLEQVYFDPYGHDNGDDGISCHYRSDSTVYGGCFEYNTKADVVHVTGSNSVCYNTQTRGTAKGFYIASAPVGDVSRVKTTMRCVNTKSYNNGYAYIASANSELICDNAVAINPTLLGYFQSGDGAIYANDCKYIGDPLKQKSGNVVINNSDLLTP